MSRSTLFEVSFITVDLCTWRLVAEDFYPQPKLSASKNGLTYIFRICICICTCKIYHFPRELCRCIGIPPDENNPVSSCRLTRGARFTFTTNSTILQRDGHQVIWTSSRSRVSTALWQNGHLLFKVCTIAIHRGCMGLLVLLVVVGSAFSNGLYHVCKERFLSLQVPTRCPSRACITVSSAISSCISTCVLDVCKILRQ